MTERELRILRAIADEIRAIRQQIESIRTDTKAKEDSKNNKPVEPLCVEVTHAPELDPARREYYEAENHERKSTWRKLKPWAEAVGVLIAIGLLGINLFTLNQIRRQADIYAEQAKTMQRQLEATDRPWVTIEILQAHGLSYNAESDAQFSFVAAMQNVGRSVATKAAIKFKVIVPKDQEVFRRPVEEQRALCGMPPNSIIKDSDHDLQTSLFPSKGSQLGFGTNVRESEIKGAAFNGKGKLYFAPILVGCVDYTAGSFTTHYQTGFIYEIRRYQSPEVHGLAFEVGVPVPLENIRLERYIFGGDYAY